MALRLDARAGDIILVWPRGTTERRAADFIAQNESWIASRRQKLAPQKIFMPGEKISIQGKAYDIIHRPGRGLTRLEGEFLIVHGQPEHLARRIKDFLKSIARQVLAEKTSEKLAMIGRKISDLRVIDPKTRWGSCSPDGGLMFSWRLILMPPEVLDYVVAHEAAHCIHMNHSKKFWALCSSLTADAAAARRWLKLHGTMVMAYA